MPALMRAQDLLGIGGMSPAGGVAAPPEREAEVGGQGYGVGIKGSADIGLTGTPSRVALMILASGGVLAALKLSGFRFNVGVSS